MGCWSQFTTAQEPKIIEIRQAGSFEKDESLYPEANILSKKGETRVHLFHKGALVVSDKSFFIPKRTSLKLKEK